MTAQKPDSTPRFLVSFEGEVALEVAQVWPDGGAPDDPTADDVVEVMRAYGRPVRVLEQWCLDDLLRIGVTRIRPGHPGDYAEHGP